VHHSSFFTKMNPERNPGWLNAFSCCVQGALWYQGESNAGQYNLYAKQMRALISGWRERWSAAGQPSALHNFTFIEHQLSAYSGE
jgi:sialate O-acetylesterase